MTAYCTLAEALSLLPTIGTLRDAAAAVPAIDADPDAVPPVVGVPAIAAVTATQPSAAQAASLLTAVCAEIDMHLRGRGYSLPVSDADGLASLKTIAMYGTASKIAKAKWPSKEGAGGDEGAAGPLREDYLRGLAFIDGGGLAPDTSSGSAGSVADGFDHDLTCLDADGFRIRQQREAPF
jgi:hypothetical protein